MSKTLKKPARVLVVNDNHDAATSLGILLASAGYEVETSFDGRAGLRRGAVRPGRLHPGLQLAGDGRI